MMKDNSYLSLMDFIGFLVVGAFLSVAFFVNNRVWGVISFIALGFCVYYLHRLIKQANEDMVAKIESLDESFDEVTKTAIFSMPFAICLLSDAGHIRWYNTHFRKLTTGEIMGHPLEMVMGEAKAKALVASDGRKPVEVHLDDKSYAFYSNKVHSTNPSDPDLHFIYGIDNTEDEQIRRAYENEGLVIGIAIIDNYDDVRGSAPDNKKPLVFAEIDQAVLNYIKDYNGYTRKYDTDRFLFILHRSDLRAMVEDRFRLLDQVREVNEGNAIAPTLSIGVGISGLNPSDVFDAANVAVDVALGRGGDQAVVKDGENLDFYGGKNKAQEKRNKVKSRVIAHALRQLIDKADQVFIMGHRNPDMDSFGACLGVLAIVNKRDKRGYIVLNNVPPTIRNIYDRAIDELPDLADHILTPQEAEEKATYSSLVVVVDNHRRNSTEAPNLLDITDKIVLIDHHRRGVDYINNPVLTYLEPYASSASELVTEILQYIDEKLVLDKVVAEALLAGITVDTKNFYYQTGVRTFEAASILKRQGADSIGVKRLFKDDLEVVRYKSEVIATSRVVENNVAIGHFNRELEGSALIASQAADDLLNIKGVSASFVLTKVNGKVHISGRSLGDVSVQLILERIGGGGHQTAAATQLEMSMANAEKMLIKSISEYFKEEEGNESHTT